MPDENLVKQLVTASRCEICGQYYEEENINILGHEDEMWVLHICCGSCHSQSLLAALIDEKSGPEAEKKFSDLTEQETQIFNNVIITADDVLDMYLFLDRYEGDVHQLFTQD